MKRNYSGFEIIDPEGLLLALVSLGITPEYDTLVLEHITYRYPDSVPAPQPKSVLITGVVSKNGVQALTVKVDGHDFRPDGKRFHITFTLENGCKPAAANKVIKNNTPTPIKPISVSVRSF